MAAEEDIRTPSRAQPEPRSKTVPREAKARDRARIVRWTPKRRRFTSPRPGTSAATRFPDKPDICRLPLPTLFYRLEAIHLGDLLRIWVRTGATPPRGPLPDFQGPRGRSGHRRNCGALRVPNHISLLEDSMELERSCRKENSSRISRRRLRVLLGCPDELSCEGPNYKRFRCRVPE
jgi:hypothetical protein